MTPDRLEKIQRLADDARGHPQVRMRAQEKLAEVRLSHPHLFPKPKPPPPPKPPPRDPRVDGMQTSPEFERRRFLDLGQWGRTKAKNLIQTVYRGGIVYRVVLFEHKKSPTWGWMLVNELRETTEFSGRFRTMGEAHADAWRMVSSL